MQRILVTGGLGFIGSHTVVELQAAGYEVIIIDDLSNSKISVLEQITEISGIKPEFHQIDLKDKEKVQQFFELQKVDGVIHFAASKAVGESVQNPLKYYENNISTLVYVLKEMVAKGVENFIFSSSCTVYGQADVLPITEAAPIKLAESPYGNTKQIGEEILKETTSVSGLKAIALRYFNPVGAHPSNKIGELPIGVPQNLIPYITQTAIGMRAELSVFGEDYDTEDGTAVRDYIHVVDLAKAHTKALERLLQDKHKASFEVFNVGTGKGNTVLDVIKTFEKVSEQNLAYKIVGRREGDITAAFADTSLVEKELHWKAELTLADALLSAWNWQKKIHEMALAK